MICWFFEDEWFFGRGGRGRVGGGLRRGRCKCGYGCVEGDLEGGGLSLELVGFLLEVY